MKNLYIFLLIFSSLFLLKNKSDAQIYYGTVNVASGANQMNLTITVNSNNSTVNFMMSGNSTKWFGFGFAATSMATGAYTILANVNGGNPAEYNQVNHSAPTLQNQQNLNNINNSTSSGIKTFTFQRAMNTSNSNDYTFTASSVNIPLIWAYGYGTSLSQHQLKGISSITLSSICNLPMTLLADIEICQNDSTYIFDGFKKIAGFYYDSLQNSIGCDSIIRQKLIVNLPSTTILADTNLCQGDTIIIFGKYIYSSGNYSDTLSNINGCDSIIKIKVINISIDTTILLIGNSLVTYDSISNYQWIDCSNNQAIIGANSNSFTPTQNGNYMLKLTRGNCFAYSSCISITNVGMSEIENKLIIVNPNPTNGRITIKTSGRNDLEIRIYDIYGRLMHQSQLRDELSIIEELNLAKGIYFYSIFDSIKILKSEKLIVQ